MTYSELYEYGVKAFRKAGIGECETDAELLLEFTFDTNRADRILKRNLEVSQEKEKEYKAYIDKRSQHVPCQYITGIQGFMGLEFEVSSYTLIPRFDTEILVETVLKELNDAMKILDMCTGSGCILLSLLKYSNFTEGLGVDISAEALKVAKRNAKRLGIKVDFIESDLFEKVEGKFDIIVSNPPYIKSGEIKELMPEVRDYEPVIALDGKEDGLYFYKKIIKEAGNFLFGGGLLCFEIGCDEGLLVKSLMEEADFRDIEIIKDLCGLDRVIKGRKKINV